MPEPESLTQAGVKLKLLTQAGVKLKLKLLTQAQAIDSGVKEIN